MRPGPLGQTWSLRGGIDIRWVQLALVLAHRGRHGFEPTGRGSVARVEFEVPIIRYVSVGATVGWLLGIRPTEPSTPPAADEPEAVVAGAAVMMLGATGKIPW